MLPSKIYFLKKKKIEVFAKICVNLRLDEEYSDTNPVSQSCCVCRAEIWLVNLKINPTKCFYLTWHTLRSFLLHLNTKTFQQAPAWNWILSTLHHLLSHKHFTKYKQTFKNIRLPCKENFCLLYYIIKPFYFQSKPFISCIYFVGINYCCK